MLNLDGVRVAFGDREVLRGVSLSLAEGERVGIVGQNGAGKTTLLRAIRGLQEYRGSIRCKGREVSQIHPREGSIILNTAILPRGSAWRSARIAGRGESGWHARALEYFSNCGARLDLLHLPSEKLSTGERQKATLAVTLLAASRAAHVLLLDEPFSGIDSSSKGEVIEGLRRFLEKKKVGLILVSHSSEDMQALAQRVVRLGEGGVISKI